MRYLLSLLVFFGAFMPLHADTLVYVSMVDEQKIGVYRLDTKSGKLAALTEIAVEGAPGALAVDPQKKFLFASLRSSSSVGSFRIDAASGKLTPLGAVSLGKGQDAAYVNTDRTGRWLLSASYGGGRVAVHKIGEDGKIESPAVETVVTAKTAHSCYTDRDNRWVFVPHVEPNAVFQFRFDATTGKLTDAGKAPGGAPKAGPRHLAFHPKLNLAYTSDEAACSVTAYRFDPESGLKPVQTLTTLPPDYKGSYSTAEVKVHPSGKWVWVSNRGPDTLAAFAIDEQGKLASLEQVPTEAMPRSFDVDPDGRFVFSAGQNTGKLSVYRVEPTGHLTRLYRQEMAKSLTWVMAVRFE